MQVVQIPLKDWRRIERVLNRLDGERKTTARAEWITASEFSARAGKTKEQLRGFRERHPELVKPKPVPPTKPGEEPKEAEATARYLYNWTGYCNIYQSA